MNDFHIEEYREPVRSPGDRISPPAPAAMRRTAVPARARAELQAEGGELARFLAPTAQKWTIVIG